MDRCSANSFCCFPRYFAFDVHHRCRASRRPVRPAALEFSFFLSMPTMVVATGFDFLKTVMPRHHETDIAPLTMNAHQWIVLVIGFVVSFFVALLVVAWFMNWVRARGFAPFALYRI